MIFHEDVTYKVGDTITIRDWDDMAEEFDSEDFRRGRNYAIEMPFGFTPGMRKFCGEKAVIIDVFFSSTGGSRYYQLKFQRFSDITPFSYGKEMFAETYAGPSTELRDKLMKGEFDESSL